ncbi:hypothetical protein H5407_07170 [Mitsuaria sp. WAJ17]|nr:hypothetical protein [Mitsuaria sp. WAJ17]MBB2485009.1 hypothetical protein [Mitsuaria sp. WAJ17]
MPAVGSGGDVFPFVEVAGSMARRGLEVTVLGPQGAGRIADLVLGD